MAISKQELQELLADRQTLLNNCVKSEHVYDALRLIELRRMRKGVEFLETMTESIADDCRSLRNNL